ncbi:MAG: Do family serine endopeptidase, partial [Pseudomonadota bacterium]|nr:Do family serine endopeptidase [Pseudomonadota bacterium]
MRPRLLRAAALAALLSASVLAPEAVYARGAPDSFADLAAQLSPAVVNVSSSQKAEARADRGPEVPGFPPGSPFEQFFRDFMERNHPGQGQGQGQGQAPGPGQRRGERPQNKDDAPGGGRAVSLGSGFIIDKSGYIVTNNHVIDGADEISVTLTDNTTLKAKLVGKDDRVDLALLKVETDHPLTAVSFGDSDTSRVGDWVLAIGNPFGLGGSVTAGIVSARGRDIRQGPYDDFIQTDAAINRGNSGGPLFNMNGEVIGINTAIYSPSGGSVGIGFSVPANLAKPVIMQLREYGHARRGWLGVRIQQVTPDIAEAIGLKDVQGAMVAGMNDGGPADKAGIHNGDVILKFNGQDVKEMRTLPRLVAETEVGKQVPVVLWRDHKEVTVQASTGELPDEV